MGRCGRTYRRSHTIAINYRIRNDWRNVILAKEKTKAITLKGTAFWAHVVKPEVYEGNELGYSVQVQLDSEEATAKLKNYLEEFWEDNKPEGKIDPKTAPNLSVKETPNGDECFKAKTKHYIEDANGQKIPKKLPIFKADGEPLEAGTLIGNGSKVQVNVTPAVYRTSSKNFGVTLYLNAILVADLVPYGERDAESYGFDVVPKAEVGDDDEEDMEF